MSKNDRQTVFRKSLKQLIRVYLTLVEKFTLLGMKSSTCTCKDDDEVSVWLKLSEAALMRFWSQTNVHQNIHIHVSFWKKETETVLHAILMYVYSSNYYLNEALNCPVGLFLQKSRRTTSNLSNWEQKHTSSHWNLKSTTKTCSDLHWPERLISVIFLLHRLKGKEKMRMFEKQTRPSFQATWSATGNMSWHDHTRC